MFRRIRRAGLVLTSASVVVAALLLAAAGSPASATGQKNWQITFAGTSQGFGFWGWCDLSGGTTFSSGLATSGSSGDCAFAEYVHVPGTFSGTCNQNLTLTGENGQPAWQEGSSNFTGMTDWFLSGTAVTNPPRELAFCQTLLGAFPPTFSDFDSLLPVIPGHTNLSGNGLREYQITETPAH